MHGRGARESELGKDGTVGFKSQEQYVYNSSII